MIIQEKPIEITLDGTFSGRVEKLSGAKIFVSFTSSPVQLRPDRWAQPVTTCIIRCEKPWVTGMGVAVCSPNDIQDARQGEWVAFRRAVVHLVDQLLPNVKINYDYWRKLFGSKLHEARQAQAAEKRALMADVWAEIAPVQASVRS